MVRANSNKAEDDGKVEGNMMLTGIYYEYLYLYVCILFTVMDTPR